MRVLAGLALAFALAACAAPAADAASPAPPPGFTATRCVNMGGALEAPSEGEWGYRIRAEDFRRLRAAGFDAVRLPVKFSAHAQPAPPYALDGAFMRRVDEVVSEALGAGLTAILTLHHYEEIHGDPAGHEARLVALWRQLGRRYRDRPSGLAFELLNEPHGPKMDAATVERLNAAALAAVRETNPERVTVVGGPRFNALEGLEGWSPPADPHVVVTFHYYAPFAFTHQDAIFLHPAPRFGRPWGKAADRAALNGDIARAAAWAQARGVHLFAGEFGVNAQVDEAQRAAWTETARRAFEQHGMSWCAWDWATTFRVYDVSRERWIAALKAALLDQ